MANSSDFGLVLARLLDYRRTNIGWLSSESGVPEAEILDVLSGVPLRFSQIDALAPALGFYVDDLCVIADVAVPEEGRISDPAAGSAVVSLIKVMMALPSEWRDRVHSLVDRLPNEILDRPADPPLTYDRNKAGFGAVLTNLLCGNRNLGTLAVAAKALALLTDGRVFLAASTVSGIGRGRIPLTPDLVAGFATSLGISTGDLAAMIGIEEADSSWANYPLTGEMAQLLWKCRHLTATQADYLLGEAKSMLVAVPDDATSDDWNRVYHQHGRWWGAPRR